MESESDTESGAPPTLVTVNQIVAWNIAWFRHEAGLTQAELAERLGWPQNKISEAERSVSGKRTREFDAQTLIGLSLALGVPLNALFLPPLDDGKDVAYRFRPPGQHRDLGMADLMRVSISDSDDDSGAMGAYRRRLLEAVEEYLDPKWRAEVASWLLPIIGREAMLEGAWRLRAERETARAFVEMADDWADVLEKTAEEAGE